MALSGSIVQNVDSHWRVVLEWTATQSISNNQSYVNSKMYWESFDAYGEVYSTATKEVGIQYNNGAWDRKTEAGLAELSAYQKKLIHEKNFTINHASDGTATFSLDGYFDVEVTLSGTFYGRIDLTQENFTLNSFDRYWYEDKRTSFLSSYNRGSFINTITGSSSAYTDGQRNSDGYWYEKGAAYTNYSKGSYVGIVTAADGTYPDDGRDGDYFYEKSSIADTPALTAPNGGETIIGSYTITWAVAAGLQTHIQISTDNGYTWQEVVTTGMDVEQYQYDFLQHDATSVARVRVRAYDGSFYSDWDESDGVFTISHNTAPTIPDGLSPNGRTLDRTRVQRFSWKFNDPNANDAQSKFDMQWRLQGATTWNDITQNTSNEYFDVSANIFPSGEIEWRVMTYDQAGLQSLWSNTIIFTSSDPTDAPAITSPTSSAAVANPTIQWSSTGQTSYQIVIEDSLNAIAWDTGEVVSGNKARTIGIDLQNSGQYTIKVRTKGGGGIWSTYASVVITVSYTPPAKSDVQAIKNESSITLNISNPLPSGTQPIISYNNIYRKENGEWSRIAKGLPSNTDYVDYAVASGQAYEYYVRAWGDNGTYSDSNTTSQSVSLSGVWLHDITNADTLHNFRADGGGRDNNWSTQSTSLQFAGRKYPVTYFSEQEDNRVTVTLQMFKAWGDYESLNQIIKAKNIVCYRDGRGRRIFGAISALPIADEVYGYSTTITITANSYSEVV